MTAPWQQARHILCVRLDSLGDVLMCTPAMRALRQAVPGRTLTLLGSPSGAAALPFIPELIDAIAWEAPWSNCAPVPTMHTDGLALVATLAARAFDAAVIFTTYTQSALPAALLCQLAGIPLRLAHCRENPYGLLTDWIPDPEPATIVRHEVQRSDDDATDDQAHDRRSQSRRRPARKSATCRDGRCTRSRARSPPTTWISWSTPSWACMPIRSR